MAAREVALKDAGAAQDRCQLLEAELKTMRSERADKARGRRAEEEKMKAPQDAVRGRDAELEQLSLEERSRTALRSLYEKGLEELLATDDEGPTQLLPYLVVALEEVVSGTSPLAEGEARILSSAALTRVFSHLHLRDPAAHLDELFEPVDAEHCAAAAEAVKGQVQALLKSFRAFDLAPSTGGAAGPATSAGGVGEGNAAMEEASLAGNGGVRG
nr:uncharacterized protein LOC109761607 [Aegilops tauschii subsp. strangulata]